ncbi:duf1446 domain protein [Fusarium tjaetaba]|uniref:Duf1446 domain protein n=1 Tax=Fusarium tjaetaba TaxID=1567544 RepID=A0A8H5R314_9HYPO|nr:duf1446 domain protein [Fusarium tjaetaba]KAF5625192.1 duf1446 domain protein [Fusarium tjaetaba]
MAATKRPVRIANISGATGDGPGALYRIVREGPVDVVTGDYLAEVNVAWLALEKQNDPAMGYDGNFLRQLDRETAHIIADKGIKVIHDGGALNPKGLAQKCQELLQSYGITSLKVACVEGDNVMDILDTLKKPGYAPHLDVKGRDLSHIDKPVLSANAYVGMSGILAALHAGADIIISGRCCDASPVMGAAAWWHGWKEDEYDKLAGALIAGHCTECGCYATGGNFSGFKSIPKNWNQGFPIAEVSSDGSFEVALQEGARGLVSKDTITAQLVYEIQGPFYLNPDVVADIRNVEVLDKSKNRVSVSGLTGQAPPPTTKLAICTTGGFQIEYYLFAVGLDVEEKLQDFRNCLEEVIPNRADYAVLRADIKETLATLPVAVGGYGLGGYCGQHACMDFRMMAPRPYVVYEPFLVPYADTKLRVTVGEDSQYVSPPQKTKPFSGQITYDAHQELDISRYGDTARAPLGMRVHARSGDKGSNANVGFWVTEDDEYDWLRSFLSIQRVKQLLGYDYSEKWEVERFDISNIRCVHFLVMGVLEGGISCSPRLDGLAKSFGEFLQSVGFNGTYGGFSQYCLADPLSTVKVPEELSDEIAAPLFCAGVTAYGAIKKAAKRQLPGSLVNIVGSGGVGHLAIIHSGADAVFNSLTTPMETIELAQSTLVVSGSIRAYQFGMGITQVRGAIIAVGAPHELFPCNVTEMVLRELSIIATNQGTRQELAESLSMAASHNIKPLILTRHVDEINEGVKDLIGGKVTGRTVFNMWK